jgi:hypothetical protein
MLTISVLVFLYNSKIPLYSSRMKDTCTLEMTDLDIKMIVDDGDGEM